MQQTSTSPLKRGGIVLVVLVGLVVAFLGARHLDSAEAHPDSVEQRMADDPAPTLFPQSATGPVSDEMSGERAAAAKLAAQWFAKHGHHADDAAFATWLKTVVPAPPSSKARTAQLSRIETIARTRTPQGTRAARWLAKHGAHDVWVAAVDAQEQAMSKGTAATRGQQLKRALRLARTTADSLAAQQQVSAPSVLRPSLRLGGGPSTPVPGTTCPCSYPSHYAASGAAASTFLGTLDPARQAQYARMQAQVDYSRLYLAGGLPSDLEAGTLLGDVVGDYVLGTRSS